MGTSRTPRWNQLPFLDALGTWSQLFLSWAGRTATEPEKYVVFTKRGPSSFCTVTVLYSYWHTRTSKLLCPRLCKQKFYVFVIMQSHQGIFGVESSIFFRRFFYWSSMSTGCYATVGSCASRFKIGVSLRRHNKPVKAFPAFAPLRFVAIDILGVLDKTWCQKKVSSGYLGSLL